jgi:hypothetical protein
MTSVRKKTLKPSRPKSGWTPAMEEALDTLLQRLTSHDEQERAAAAGVWEVVTADVRRRLVQRLVDQLRSRSEATRRAAESLTEAGEPAVPPLCVAFRNATSAPVRVCLAGVLGRIGRTMGPAARLDVENYLGLALSAAKDGAVVAAILGAMETMEPGSAAVHLATLTAPRGPGASGPVQTQNVPATERNR